MRVNQRTPESGPHMTYKLDFQNMKRDLERYREVVASRPLKRPGKPGWRYVRYSWMPGGDLEPSVANPLGPEA
jgi:hypothetical protein